MLPTITHIHTAVIPVLAGSGTIFLDSRAHKTIYDGCQVARAHGAQVQRFQFEDPDRPRAAAAGKHRPAPADLHGRRQQHDRQRPRPARVRARRPRARGAAVRRRRPRLWRDRRARRRRAVLVRQARQQHRPPRRRELRDVVLVGGFSKAYSSLLAFIACPTEIKQMLKVAAPPYLYSGPSPVASLATVLTGFDVNDARGDTLRADICAKTARVLDCLRTSRRRDTQPLRLPGDRDPDRPPRRRSLRSAGSCSIAASTSPWPCIRWCRGTRWGYGCRSLRPTPMPSSTG